MLREPLLIDEAERLARMFKALGDPIRLRLLSMIASHEGGEACVCELACGGFSVTGPTISHHLKVLREAGLIEGERRGTWIYYRAFTRRAQRARRCPPGGPAGSGEPVSRRLVAELVGTGLLVTVVVGSGIAAQKLSPHQTGLQLLENSTATVLGLGVLILLFGPVSGAHLNPVVSVADWALGRGTGTGLAGGELAGYITAQLAGGIAGAVLANVMFDLAPLQIATTSRATPGRWLGEVVATAGLIAVIFALARTGRTSLSAATVASYIGAAYWFTSSTSFANPAVTVGRMFSDTFAGIASASAPQFVLAQLIGALLGAGLVVFLYPDAGHAGGDVVTRSTRSPSRTGQQ